MALYEYQCEACGHRVEVIRKWSDPPLEKCPKCAGPVHKLQSAPAFHLKGTGWYVTDYAKKDQGGTPQSSEETKSETKSSSDSSDKGEKSEKSDKADKAEKAEKGDKGEKSEKSDKSDKPADSAKSTSTGSSSSSSTAPSKSDSKTP